MLALATPASGASINYRFESDKIGPGVQSPRLIARCGPDRHVLGGGAFISVGSAVMNSTLPVDLGDGDARRDDGWGASMTNLTTIDAFVTTYAVCAEQHPRYVFRATSFMGELSTGESCPEGSRATGVGVRTSGGGTNTFIRTLMPYDPLFSQARQVRAVIKGFDFADTPVGVYGVCSDDLNLRYRVGQLNIPPNDSSQVFIRCRYGREVVGGGGLQGTVGTGWELRTLISIPSDSGDAGHVPDDSWRLSVSNPSGEQRTIATVAVCAQ